MSTLILNAETTLNPSVYDPRGATVLSMAADCGLYLSPNESRYIDGMLRNFLTMGGQSI